MQHPLSGRPKAQPSGVIETLSAGYTAVNRQLWVLALPILLDLFLWLGPRVSYSPLIDPVVVQAAEVTRQVALVSGRDARGPDVLNRLGGVDASRQWMLARADDVNGLSALAWSPIALPSLRNVPSTTDELAFVSGWPDGLMLLAASAGLGLLLGGWFYVGLASASTGRRGGPVSAGRSTPRAVVDVLGLIGVLVGLAVLLGLPVVVLIGFTWLVSPPVAVLGSVLVGAGVLFAGLHLFFAVPAIFVSSAGPLAAIQHSVAIVRRHLRPSLALILLTWLILAGMAQVWGVLGDTLQSPYGVALSIFGNAYIASGLIAAGMIFYTQRTEPLAPGAANPS